MAAMVSDTIAAIATPPGAGGIGILRISGPRAAAIAGAVAGRVAAPREAAYRAFRDAGGEPIDRGLLLYFPAPASYTGEDVCELHGHGSTAVLDMLLARVLELGARAARPGEFTERAFHHGKLDLAQAEAVADLIAARSARAARATRRTLAGDFSRAVVDVMNRVHEARALLEATLDFPDELDSAALAAALLPRLAQARSALAALLGGARRGARLNAGANVVIAGPPNAGKSTLLNCLAGADRAIVSPLPGTTRDVVQAEIVVAGMTLRMADTAGLRDAGDAIEAEGIKRAAHALAEADLILLVVEDDTVIEPAAVLAALGQAAAPEVPVISVHNKIDTRGAAPRLERHAGAPHVYVAAKHGLGLALLEQALAEQLDVDGSEAHEFSARTRHVDALLRAQAELLAVDVATLATGPELGAEHLRLAERALGEITGAVTSEDLLGTIFARFCLGK